MEAWPRCLERLEAELPAEDVHTWLRPLQAARREDATVLYAPNVFIRDAVKKALPADAPKPGKFRLPEAAPEAPAAETPASEA